MLKLGQSKKFKQEYELFKNKINKIEDEEFKKELNLLLTKLVTEVKNIDSMHSDLISHNRLPIGSIDTKNNIMSIRKELVERLKDWDEFLKETQQS